MNKALNKKIKDVLFKYINIVFNISESSDLLFTIQILNAKDFYYDIVSELERIGVFKKATLYTIDLDFEDFGMSEIDKNGKHIIPEWLKTSEHSIIVVYNLDSLGKRNYKIKQLKEILTKGTIEGVKVPSNKHFIILSDKDIGIRETVIRIDLKKALELVKEKK